ncbi:hypothetical protein A2483_03185 [Candidatus Peregrinibacteria bacterium RIFOXYC2_FULL_33_13]|nr:MAG: hypothetical protein UR27_C0001G0023 [Candidatus Peregrinibacteria bacterium GW2011_GWA2_33_10]KKP39753.1 MAG: hypothetical protein UR30_C0008G0022 [Candidatus Peregrinibacteria bacterium GW2011_GWC2_33_13]OGJ50441.1 MAG: hypothetical protein A2229_02465 [Candidatus Peregrinibacteria bacterium RIFOXYA2_FULL_33_7]OGJ52096.1 MAG: hypothetical protein A2483_03185 [Candidatus Peregrinibacteria bacterium RIFOXYC2_FULL_33_13]
MQEGTNLNNQEEKQNSIPQTGNSISNEEKKLSAISYVPFGFIYTKNKLKNSSFCQFHIKQSIIFLGVSIIIIIGLFFLSVMIGIFSFLIDLYVILYFILAGFAASKALKGEKWIFPSLKPYFNQIDLNRLNIPGLNSKINENQTANNNPPEQKIPPESNNQNPPVIK